MRTDAIPFKFDISHVMAIFARMPNGRPSFVKLTLPFITVLAQPSAREKKVAHDLLVRLRDRRVLSSRECCDNCIDQALASLQEIRSKLVEAQIELISEKDGVLSGLIELMLVSIRQFLTFEQSINIGRTKPTGDVGGFYRGHEDRQTYFDALEQLRGHLSRCLGQLAIVAGLNVPSDGIFPEYQGPWDLKAYIRPTAEQLNGLTDRRL